jgi:hypothetical protein
MDEQDGQGEQDEQDAVESMGDTEPAGPEDAGESDLSEELGDAPYVSSTLSETEDVATGPRVPLPPGVELQQVLTDGKKRQFKTFDEWMGYWGPYIDANPEVWRIQFHRIAPMIWNDTHVAGYIGEIRFSVSTKWVSENLGGGKYNVNLMGPQTRPGRGGSCLRSRWHPLVIAGDPRPSPHDRHFQTEKGFHMIQDHERGRRLSPPVADEPSSQGMDQVTSQLLKSMTEVQREATEQRARMEELLRKKTEEETTAARELLQREIASIRQDIAAGGRKDDSSMMEALIRILKPEPRKDEGHELDRLHQVINGLRGDLVELQKKHTEELEHVRRSHRDEIDVLRDIHRKGTDDAKALSDQRLADLRSQHELMISSVREGHDQRVAHLTEQVADLRTQLSSAQTRLTAAESDAQRARLDEVTSKIKSEMIVQKPADTGLGGFAATLASIIEIRSALENFSGGGGAVANPAKEKTSAVDRLMAIAEKAADKAIKDGVLNKLLERKPEAPTQQQQVEWEKARQQLREKPVVWPAEAQTQPALEAPAPMAPTVELPSGQTPEAQGDFIRELEDAAAAGTSVPDFVQGMLQQLGVEQSALAGVINPDDDASVVLESIGVDPEQLTRGARTYLDRVVDEVKRIASSEGSDEGEEEEEIEVASPMPEPEAAPTA